MWDVFINGCFFFKFLVGLSQFVAYNSGRVNRAFKNGKFMGSSFVELMAWHLQIRETEGREPKNSWDCI